MKKELKALSASRVKTLENCSWLYYCNYHLKVPQKQNEGAKKGSICHTVFEMLLSKNRKEYFNKIVKNGSIKAIPSIERLVKRHIKKLKVMSVQDSFIHIDKMILVGLTTDFYVEGGQCLTPEYKFDITNEEPQFRIRGLMDKPSIRGNEVIIDDFKSSKNVFSGEDQESNLQALFYSYAATVLWPGKPPTVRFIFLQHPKNALMEVKFTKEALDGFRYYLEASQLKVEGFNEKVSHSNFAADSPEGKDTFSGKSLCGRANSPTQLKKDGTPMWHCPYKFAFDYYVIKKDEAIIESALTMEELRPLKKGEKIDLINYSGCPRHVNILNKMSPTKVKDKIKYPNVLNKMFRR